MKKVFKFLDKTLDAAIMLVCVLLLLIGAYSIADNLYVYSNASDKGILAYKPDMKLPLSESFEVQISPDQIAWLYLYDTNIDYPVMQGEDNFEYLNIDPYGEFSLGGSIFLDYRCSGDLSDEYSLIYGHHMEHGVMFGSLDDFADRAFFDAHRGGRIVTKEKAYEIELFAVASALATERTLFSPVGRTGTQITEYLSNNSIIYTQPEAGLPIIALSTCSGDTLMSRLLVFGVLKPQ
ncbi:MAG: class B sortase [Clostridia bacterium]|nr:class B sortase [Clostridia bacterium]